ncbi:hypothetical protein D3C81_1088820 [compost metagenome]
MGNSQNKKGTSCRGKETGMRIVLSDNGNGISDELAAAVGLTIALKYQRKVLLVNEQCTESGVEYGFNIPKMTLVDKTMSQADLQLPEHGVDALLRLSSNQRLTKQNITDYTYPIIPGRLDLASGSKTTNHGGVSSEIWKTSMESMYSVAERVYDIVIRNQSVCRKCSSLIMCPCSQSYINNEIERESEINILIMEQKRSDFEQVYKRYQENNRMDYQAIVISNYDGNSKWSINNIKRKYDFQVPVIGVSSDTRFKDAWNDKEIVRFFRRNLLLPKQGQKRDSLVYGMLELSEALLKIVVQTSSLAKRDLCSSGVKGA